MTAFPNSGRSNRVEIANMTGRFRPEAALRFLRSIIVNQLEAFTDEHHFAVEAAVAFKILLMIASPSFQTVILSFGERKTFINIAKPHLGNFQCFDD